MHPDGNDLNIDHPPLGDRCEARGQLRLQAPTSQWMIYGGGFDGKLSWAATGDHPPITGLG